jgi:hypothetical protein
MNIIGGFAPFVGHVLFVAFVVIIVVMEAMGLHREAVNVPPVQRRMSRIKNGTGLNITSPQQSEKRY